MTCQQIKAEHKSPAGKLQSLEIPVWKWDHITMDFVTALPRIAKGRDSIWVIVDRLTKVARFLPVRADFKVPQYSRIYMREIVRLHGAPVSIERSLSCRRRKSTRLNSSHRCISYAVFCLKKKNRNT